MTVRGASQADRSRKRGIAQSCLLSAALWALGACAPSTANPTAHSGHGRRDSASSRPVALIVSGDTAGWIMPCGCTANQSGGLARRGTFVERVRADHAVVLVDAGGAPGGTSPYERLKFEAILAAERAMGVAAHNLGAAEAALGAEYLREVQQKRNFPFLSTNLRDAAGALVAASTLEVVASPAGMRIKVLGVVSPRLVPGGLRADEPRDAILRAIGNGPASDVVVVLAYLPEPELRELADALPEVDLVVGGPTGQSIAPAQAGPTLLASATNKGKFLIELEAAGRGARWSGQVVELSPAFPDEPALNAILDQFHTELARRDFAAEQTGLVPPVPSGVPAGYHIAGTEACRACHRDDCETWNQSKHALAWRTLEERGLEVDPQCQRCHTTGYGLPGGFQSRARSPERRGVGCESCHGPSQGHVKEPRARTPFAAKDQCASCHDPENSPRFAFDDYWKLVRHGDHTAQAIEKHGEGHP